MFPHNEFCMQNVASVTFMPFLNIHNFIIYHPNSKYFGNYVERYIDCWIVTFGRILIYLDVALQTLNTVCHKFKIYISSFSWTCTLWPICGLQTTQPCCAQVRKSCWAYSKRSKKRACPKTFCLTHKRQRSWWWIKTEKEKRISF